MTILKEIGETIVWMLKDWPMGTIIGILLIGVSLFVLALVGWVIFTGLDFIGRENQTGIGRVISKEFIPAHTTTSTMMIGRVSVPTTHHHPDAWVIQVEIDGSGTDSVSVDEKFYDAVTEGTQLSVEYSTGRFTGNPSIAAVSM
ncbi:MAG: hypothetical protein G01um101420_721 [Parcubacteria group bacterium Gr01-1014_20]|nr:MAG: hypothetical protein G01um101420_721 [Parcubacteria group bacterium Gr01-1014_20]